MRHAAKWRHDAPKNNTKGWLFRGPALLFLLLFNMPLGIFSLHFSTFQAI